MSFINPFGLIFMIFIMIPNIIFAIKIKDGFENCNQNKVVEILEQIGRYGSFAFMIFNLLFCNFGFASDEAFAIYFVVNSVLIFAYCLIWIFLFNKKSIFRAISLSALPGIVFLFSGILSCDILLIISSVIFAPCHIFISCKNSLSR
ncbi:MAG: hypothetical protein II196_08425, partial [Spirochaetales bacterium]|nr:hypothetical protein [Spirochaetales bacterium]